MKQKFIKLTVWLMAFVCLAASLCGAVQAASVTKFSDVPRTHWGYPTIMRMTEAGIFKGTTTPVNGVGTFSPELVMTRAEFITASLRAIYPNEAKRIGNGKIKWWSGYYAFAVQKGILAAEELNGGNLDKPMTREEMAMVMVRCVEKNGEKLTQRIDTAQIADYQRIGDGYKDYVRDCFSFGLLCGIDEKGTFAPTKSLTRAEAATALCRLIDKAMRVEVEFPETPEDTSSAPETVAPQYPWQEDVILIPWENGGKPPVLYTWAEFTMLSDVLKNAFIQSFGSIEVFNLWMRNAQGTQSGGSNLPWENGGKQPSQYTWAEYLALSDTLKSAFRQSFANDTAFLAWLNRVQGTQGGGSNLPWENGGKQPSEYTWAEYLALSDTLKSAFRQSFANDAAFTAWLNRVQSPPAVEEKLPWENGGKQPAEYTWAEYEALSDTLKNAFCESFATEAAFEAWLSKAQGTQNGGEKLPWENGGKQPAEYTWAEYEALPDSMKNAFYESFESEAAFNAWWSRVQGTQGGGSNLPWENGGKQPAEYTWAEYEALPDSMKNAFYESFESEAAFNAWWSRVQSSQGGGSNLPWENGGKQPAQYTWAEFEALPDALKEAFANSFDTLTGFADWLEANQP